VNLSAPTLSHSCHFRIAIGRRLCAARAALELSQQEMAAKLGIARQTLARYENGHCEPLSSLLALLCEDFGLNPSWLLIGDNTPMFITGTETATFRRAAS
jgi:transcriptional regulator with XRE-family HTH domain